MDKDEWELKRIDNEQEYHDWRIKEMQDCFVKRQEAQDAANLKDRKFEEHCASIREIAKLNSPLSFRDQAAIAVMPIASEQLESSLGYEPTRDAIARTSFDLADAMESERKKRSQ